MSHNICKKMRSLVSRVFQDRRGSTGIMFGLMAVPIVSIAGVSVDYARFIDARAEMQSKLDAAVIVASREDPEFRPTTAVNFFEGITTSDWYESEINVTENSENTL